MMSRPGKTRKLLQATALLALMGAGNAWGGCIVYSPQYPGSVTPINGSVSVPHNFYTSKDSTLTFNCQFRGRFSFTISDWEVLVPEFEIREIRTGVPGFPARDLVTSSPHTSLSGTSSFTDPTETAFAWVYIKPSAIMAGGKSIPPGTPVFRINYSNPSGAGGTLTFVANQNIDLVAEACTLNNNAPLDIDLGSAPSTKVTADIRTSLPRKTVSIPVRCTQPINHPANMRITGTLVNSGGTTLLTSSNDALGIGFLTGGTPAEAVTASQLKVPAQITAGAGTVNLEVAAVKRGDIQDIGPFNASATLILSSD